MPGHSFPIFRAALRCAVLCYGTCTRSPGHNHPWHGVFRTANVDSQKSLIDQTERHPPVWNAFAWKHSSRSVRQTEGFFCKTKPPPYDIIAVNQIVVVHQMSSSASRQCRTVPKKLIIHQDNKSSSLVGILPVHATIEPNSGT